MTDQLSFEAYLSLSHKKFEIYLLDKKNLKNIYKEEIYVENDIDLIDYNLLSSFLDNNIFKIEKLIGNFLTTLVLVIENKAELETALDLANENELLVKNKVNLQFLNY